jgi:hypothetical protein
MDCLSIYSASPHIVDFYLSVPAAIGGSKDITYDVCACRINNLAGIQARHIHPKQP